MRIELLELIKLLILIMKLLLLIMIGLLLLLLKIVVVVTLLVVVKECNASESPEVSNTLVTAIEDPENCLEKIKVDSTVITTIERDLERHRLLKVDLPDMEIVNSLKLPELPAHYIELPDLHGKAELGPASQSGVRGVQSELSIGIKIGEGHSLPDQPDRDF